MAAKQQFSPEQWYEAREVFDRALAGTGLDVTIRVKQSGDVRDFLAAFVRAARMSSPTGGTDGR